jgi:integrase/recombinase XerC/integrase/recombinase XerD
LRPAPDEVDAERFAEWFGSHWTDRAPSTWNVSLDAVRSAAAYWQRQGWLAADFSRMLVRRKPRPDRDRALSRSEVDQLLTRKDISLRERTLWRTLYDTAACSAEVLALNMEVLDLANRCTRVRRKGGAIDVIIWQTGTARLLPCLLKGRKSGPVFVIERKARVQLPACDLLMAVPGSATSRPRRCSPRPPAARRCISSGIVRSRTTKGAELHLMQHSGSGVRRAS